MLSSGETVSPPTDGSANSDTPLTHRTSTLVDTAPSRSPRARLALVCRQIRDDDLDAAVACLARGFPERTAAYWRRAFLRLRDRHVPEGRPRYGYVMMADDVAVGIVLLIYALTDEGSIRANVSSWFVDPAYRAFSGMLLAAPMRAKDVTFVNISPAPTTIETITAQGFSRYVGGTYHALAALSRRAPGARVRAILSNTAGATPLLAEHAACGCISLEVVAGGQAHPFVFVPFRSVRNRIPSAQLVYCRAIDEFVRFAGPLGRHLARLGFPAVMIDANGPIAGLRGRYVANRRVKYYRGPTVPRLGDLSATELVYLGP